MSNLITADKPKLNVKLTAKTAPLIARDLNLWCNWASGGEWQPYPHIRTITDRLYKCFDPSHEMKRLIIEMPPRHGKTFTSAILAPCFYLGYFPNKEVQVITHTADYSEKIGGRAKTIFDHYARILWGRRVSRESGAKSHWRVDGHNGGINASGIEGNIIGQGADLLIIDDPYSSLEQACSPSTRKKVWDIYTGTLRTRLHNDASIVVIHQRAHAEDLIGMIKKTALETGEDWHVLTFKAIAEQDEYLDGEFFRAKGEALCEERQELSQLLEHKAGMSRFKWLAHFQQTCIRPEGAFWDAEYFPDTDDASCFVDAWPAVDRLVVAVDPSMGKASKQHDYQAVVALGTNGDGNFYTEAWLEKLNVNELCQNIATFISTRLPRVPEVVGVEAEAAQELILRPLHDTLKKNQIWTSTYPINNKKVNKLTRIRRLDPWITNQRMRFIASKGSRLLVEQLKEFPCRQSHDDGPDALEMAFSLLAQSG